MHIKEVRIALYLQKFNVSKQDTFGDVRPQFIMNSLMSLLE